MMRSARRRRVWYSRAVKYLGAYSPLVFCRATASCACWAASSETDAAPPRPSWRSASRRERSPVWSDIAFFHLLAEILGRSPRQRHDAKRDVLIGITQERRGVRHEQIFHFVRLAVAIEHGGLRIVSHADGAGFVNDFSAERNRFGGAVWHGLGKRLAAHGFDDVGEGLVHVPDHIDFVLAPAEMEAQNGNAPLVDLLRVDLAIGIFIGDHLAASCEAYITAVIFANVVFERVAVAFVPLAFAAKAAQARHAETATDFDVIATREILVFLVQLPPGHVDVHAADAVGIMARHIHQRRNMAAQAVADGIGKIAPDHAG